MAKYHMNKSEREIKDRAEISRLLKRGKYATIALCRDNEPYIVTLSCGYDEETESLYFHSALKGLKIDFLKSNPAACATIIEDRGYVKNDCRHEYSSLVIFGKMEIIEGLEDKKRALEILLKQLEDDPGAMKERFIKNEAQYGSFCMLKLKVEHLTGKSGS